MDEFRFEEVVDYLFFHFSVVYANVNMEKPLSVAVFLIGFEEIHWTAVFTAHSVFGEPWERLESIMARLVNFGHDERLVG